MNVESIAECSLGAFCNTFDLHLAIIGLENQFLTRRATSHLVGTLKPVLSSHSKIGKTKVFKINGSLMKAESIVECSLGAFCNTFDLHLAIIGLENQFWSSYFLSGPLRLYCSAILNHFLIGDQRALNFGR